MKNKKNSRIILLVTILSLVLSTFPVVYATPVVITLLDDGFEGTQDFLRQLMACNRITQ